MTGEKRKGQSQPFKAFAVEALAAMEAVASRHLEEFDVHHAFDHWIAELFETTNNQAFVFTDGANDHSIDFAVRGLQSYSIYQCKCPAVETLLSSTKAPTFDAAAVDELLESVAFMSDAEGEYKAKASVRDLRSDYQHDRSADPEATSLTATLAVMGDLTEQARLLLEAQKDVLYADGVSVQLITWRDIQERVHAMSSGSYEDVTVDLHVQDMQSDVLHQPDWIFALASGGDLVDAMEAYGPRLFDLNVRQEIPNSVVNKEIVKTLRYSKSRRVFHHLNNGLLITCTSFAKKGDRIRVSGAQVVNGCQTVSSLYQAYKALPPREQALFREETRVQVKVVQNIRPELLEQIVISTNNQNPMKPRNLRSNSPEQKLIQRQFGDLGWFYVRKDGEFEALCAAGKRASWFRRADYKSAQPLGGRSKDRVIDNLTVAKAWYAFVGNSNSVLQGGQDYFGNDLLYARIFRDHPSDETLVKFVDPDFEGIARETLEEGPPSASQFLLATSIAAFMRATSKSSYTNRRESLLRGIEQGKLKGDAVTGTITSSSAEQANWLAHDTAYQFNNYLINMEDVLVELYGFSLARRYGPLTAGTSRAILGITDISAWVASGYSISPEDLAAAHPMGVLSRTSEFVRWAAKNYCVENRFHIEASPRPKMFFAKRETVRAMRAAVLENNKLSRDAFLPWKPQPDTDFLSTLPPVDIPVNI